MIRKYLLPVAATAMLVFAVVYVARAQQKPPKPAPPVTPASSPFSKTVAGAGIVEAETENISIGSPLPGIVTQVAVKVGETVKPGALLFSLDDRQLQAELTYRYANLDAAEAQLDKLEKQPRPEELPTAQARVREAEANLADQEDQLKRTRNLYASHSISSEELVGREQARRAAREKLAQAQADLNLLKAGAWAPDKAVAQAAVELAESQVEQTQTDLDRLRVTAPSVKAGEPLRVLQVNVRPGEYVGTPPGQPLMMLGCVGTLHVRVDIDEHDIPRFQPGAPAVATLRGNPGEKFALHFVRVEPFVIPKKSLTGDNTERVDTRVLQVIYAVEGQKTLYVGQQMDVSVDGDEANAAYSDHVH